MQSWKQLGELHSVHGNMPKYFLARSLNATKYTGLFLDFMSFAKESMEKDDKVISFHSFINNYMFFSFT